MSYVISVCDACADKLRESYELNVIEESSGQCFMCKRQFRVLSKAGYKPKRRAVYSAPAKKRGGGERNREDDDE